MFRPPGDTRLPTGTGGARPVLVHAPTTVASPSGSYRIKLVWSVPSTRPTSAVIAAKVSAGEAPSATSVATRRSAACWSSLRRRSVTSRPTAYTRPSAGTARALH